MEQNLLGAGKTWAPVVIWMALIFTFSTDWFAAPNTSSFFGPLLSWLIPGIAAETIQIVHAALRKLGHWTEYFILAILLGAACKAQWPKQTWRNRFVTTVIITTLYAISDEWHQSFVPGRDADLHDVWADAIGAVAGAAGCWAWGIIRSRSDV
jgi:VanZ family protein